MTAMPTAYELRVVGHLDDRWANWFGEVTLTRNGDGTTTLVGPVTDQAHLHGILARIRDLGATLLSLQAGQRREDIAAGHHNGEPAAVSPALEHPIRTERLTIRPATEQDADATWAFRRLASVNEWLTGAPANVDAYRAVFNDPARLATTAIVALGERDDGAGSQVIGDLMLKREDAWAQIEVTGVARGTQAEVGWVLDPTYSGRGYATEAVRALFRYCFEDLGVRRLVANCFLDNEASWRLMERVGMRRETHAQRDSLHRTGQWLDTFAYAILAEEWAASTTS
ncbi:GNAT family N-acetyltransferase [Angustibacter sp. McL0619]|uniref:GNAT family N-acetyltransferase n=1 Tax=Angustibacter sp. McL0619 TaxID=3415676 RepID=UPI003CE9C34A